MGVNQSHEGVRTAQAIINLALMTGNIGKPGTGVNSITGQCNAMGLRLFSNTTNLLGGHDFENPTHRQKIADILRIDVNRIPNTPSWAYDQIMEGILRNQIKGLWVIATNTAHSWINQADAHDILERLDFLVVQDMYYTTETAAFADLVLPAAGWGEKDCSAGMPCNITGIEDYARLDIMRGIQWPLPQGQQVEPLSERRLFEDSQFYTSDGRAWFVFEATRALPEFPNRDYPFMLLTGRGSSSQWHTQTRTGKSEVLHKLAPNVPYVEIRPQDAAAQGIRANAWVIVRSAAWHGTGPGLCEPCGATRAGLHADALCQDEPIDPGVLRPLLTAAIL